MLVSPVHPELITINTLSQIQSIKSRIKALLNFYDPTIQFISHNNYNFLFKPSSQFQLLLLCYSSDVHRLLIPV